MVALHLPTLGGRPPAGPAERASFRRAVVAALIQHEDVLRASLQHTPQTNETGRAPLLRMALSRQDPALPVRLREIGASAGLNLRADHLDGLPGLESGPLPEIVDRIGCDRAPVDVSTVEGRLLLSSYVWADDVVRFERLRHALAVADAVPATVVRADAAEFCEQLVLAPSTTTFVWQSAMWIYLPVETRMRVHGALATLGSTAAPSSPLVHCSYEWDPRTDGQPAFSLVMRTWSGTRDDGRPRLLARGLSHGDDVRAAEGEMRLESDPLVNWAGEPGA